MPLDRENFSSRRGGASSARGGRAAPGRDDFADSARRGKNQRSDLPVNGFDRAGRTATTDPTEGKPGGARRIVSGNRARIQERAGDDFGLRTDDPVGIFRSGGFGLRRTHPRANAKHHARGDGVFEVRGAGGNSGRRGGGANDGGTGGCGSGGNPAPSKDSMGRDIRRCRGRRRTAAASPAEPGAKRGGSVRDRGVWRPSRGTRRRHSRRGGGVPAYQRCRQWPGDTRECTAEAIPAVLYDKGEGDRAGAGGGTEDCRAAWRPGAGAEPARGRGGGYRYATHSARGARSSTIEAGKHLRECRGLPAARGR